MAIVDAPNQRNVGDSLIWLGELAYLEELECRIDYVADLKTYDARALRRSLPVGGIVLFHGGGNFGDLWLGHQDLRERVAQDLMDYRVVQLPESVFFNDLDRARLADERLSRHPDFHVLIRDSLSERRMVDQLPNVRFSFCPDMAFGWDPPARKDKTRKPTDLLVLARTDKEASSGLAEAAAAWSDPGVLVTDWHPQGALRLAASACAVISRVCGFYAKVRKRWTRLPARGVDRRYKHLITAIALVNYAGAERLYRASSHIVVDRLHAHVLAVLLGIPHTALDNNYGKVSSIYSDYSGVFSTATFAPDPSAALANFRDGPGS